METKTLVRGNAHTIEQESWAKEKIDSGVFSMKTIKQNNIPEEYERKFGKRLTVAGFYSWFRLVKDPSLREKKREYQRNKQSGNSNSRSISKEKETFSKSNYLLYVNHNLVGFESMDMIKEFLKDNQVLAGDIRVFRNVPAKIEYKIEIGE